MRTSDMFKYCKKDIFQSLPIPLCGFVRNGFSPTLVFQLLSFVQRKRKWEKEQGHHSSVTELRVDYHRDWTSVTFEIHIPERTHWAMLVNWFHGQDDIWLPWLFLLPFECTTSSFLCFSKEHVCGLKCWWFLRRMRTGAINRSGTSTP